MANNIAPNSNRPRAIAKEKDGIVMFWVEELGIAGLHVRGIARLLECNPSTVHNALQGVQAIATLEAEIVTEQGIRTVQLVAEAALAELLEVISLSKTKSDTRRMAMQVLKRLAAAGFKLAVMLELAPQQLKAQVDQHLQSIVLETELERAKLERSQADQKLLDTRHYIVTALPEAIQQKILGYTEVKTIEYRDRIIQGDKVIRDGSTLSRTEVCKRLGITRGKQADCKMLDTLLAQLPSDAVRLSAVVQEYTEVKAEYLPLLARMWGEGQRNLYLGE